MEIANPAAAFEEKVRTLSTLFCFVSFIVLSDFKKQLQQHTLSFLSVCFVLWFGVLSLEAIFKKAQTCQIDAAIKMQPTKKNGANTSVEQKVREISL